MTPSDLKFTKSHEWVTIEGKTAVVGISEYAQESLGDITFIELPAVGKKVVKGTSCCVIESVKAASDIYAPVSGEISEVNSMLESHPETINVEPYAAWLFKITNFADTDTHGLLDAGEYDEFVESEQ